MNYYDNIKLEKGLYRAGESFSDTLEKLDPSANYQSSHLAELDAFERQLKRFDIRIKGSNSDRVDKFFTTSSSATLFPEFVKRCVEQGIKDNSILADIIAANTKIDSLDYRPLAASTSSDECELQFVSEGAVIPTTKISVKENLIRLSKRGRMLESSYEAIKYQRLDLFAVTLKQIGSYIARTQLTDAISTIIDGDGHSNSATNVSVATAGELTYSDLINLWSKFQDFNMNRLIVAPDVMKQLLSLDEFANQPHGIGFNSNGEMGSPFGAKIYHSTAVPAGKIIALDQACAIEMVTASDIAIESDKLIDRQLERATITSTTGFAKIFTDASYTLTV